MAKPKKKQYSERQQRSRRAAKLREKVKNGGALTDDEREWLEAYEAAKATKGDDNNDDGIAAAEPDSTEQVAADNAGRKGVVPEPDSEVRTEEDMGDDPAHQSRHSGAGPRLDDASPAPPPPPPRAPPLPRPPRVDSERETSAKSGKSNWRSKYEGADSDGREATCKIVADQWHGVLRVLADQIKASGVDPIVNPDDLYGSIILTVDELMPEHVRLTPRARALAGTTAILAHRFMRRKEISEALDKQNARKEHEQWQAERIRQKEKNEATKTVESEAVQPHVHAAASVTAESAKPSPTPSPSSHSPGSSGSVGSVSADDQEFVGRLNAHINRERARQNGANDAPDGEEVIY